MAQRVHIVLEDDLDGSAADETVTFGLDGANYEIDLSAKNAAKLRDALAPYVGSLVGTSSRAVARAVPGPRPPAGHRLGTSASGPRATATRSPSAAGSRPTSRRRTTPPTDAGRPSDGAGRAGPARLATSRRASRCSPAGVNCRWNTPLRSRLRPVSRVTPIRLVTQTNPEQPASECYGTLDASQRSPRTSRRAD